MVPGATLGLCVKSHGEGFSHTVGTVPADNRSHNMAYLQPIEIRFTKHPNGGYTYYTALKVYPGIGNTAAVSTKFMTRSDATTWAKREYPDVPRIFD